MGFQRVCSLDDVWEGEMESFEVDGKEVLIVNGEGGLIRAFHGTCPHQDHPLSLGSLEGKTLTCSAHLWQFDIDTGMGTNPTGCSLKAYPVKIEDGDIYVDTTE